MFIKNLALGAALMLAMPFVSAADDDIDLKELPQSVVMAIGKRFPGATLLEAEKDEDDDRIEYDVEIRHDGKRYEVEVTQDGRITDIDREDD